MNNPFSGLLRRLSARSDQSDIQIGFLPTVDAAVLIVAQEKGFFAEERLNVNLVRDTSWHHLRDRLCQHEVVAAHLPGTVPLATSLGIGCPARPLMTALVLSLNGASLVVKPEVAAALGPRDPHGGLPALAKGMAQLVRDRQQAGAAKMKFAVSGLTTNGSYDLRYWLAEGGVDPLNDVELVAITPARVLSSLRAGRYDAALLDEPFATASIDEGLMVGLFGKHEFWNHSLGKVLAVNADWCANHPRLHLRLLRALMASGQWLEENRAEAAALLAQPQYMNASEDLVARALSGAALDFDRPAEAMCFAHYAAGFPWYSQAVWYLSQMIRWGDYAEVMDFKKTAQAVYTPRLYREAARDIGLPYPTIGYKDEGLHDGDWNLEEASRPIVLGADQFFDQRLFRPRQTMKYLNGLAISHIRAPLEAMWAIR